MGVNLVDFKDRWSIWHAGHWERLMEDWHPSGATAEGQKNTPGSFTWDSHLGCSLLPEATLILCISLCATHIHNSKQTWEFGEQGFFLASVNKVELMKLINHSSQTDIVQLIFKSQPGSILYFEDLDRSSNLKAKIAPFSNYSSQTRQTLNSISDLRWMVSL